MPVLKRVIPVLQLHGEELVKTIRYRNPQYIGDPNNTLRIFNELEVDEIAIVDIRATVENRSPNLKLLRTFADECFMPLAYGGGITSVSQAREIFSLGYEKIIVGSVLFKNPQVVRDMVSAFGSQAIVAAVDLRKPLFRAQVCWIDSAQINTKKTGLEWAKMAVDLGVGELLITNVDREGTWKGLDLEAAEKIANSVSIPVIVQGGAKGVEDINLALGKDCFSAIGLGNMVIYQGPDLGVLVNFPNKKLFGAWYR